MNTITAPELRQKLERVQKVHLIDVLPEDRYAEEHVPGAVNVPVQRERFVETVREHVGDRTAEVIVYCASPACDASPKAARKLADAGFEQVVDFEGGLREWKEQGYPLAGEAVSR